MSESVIERLFREAAVVHWWPELPLEQEHVVIAEGSRYKIDFALPALRFGIELDGHATHSSPTAIASDRKRQRALERAGWVLCRFGGQEVTRDPENCLWEAKSALSGIIAEDVSARDRSWFTEHPQACEYWRPYIPGESPEVLEHGAKVLVRKMPWGRARQFSGKVIAGEPLSAALKIAKATPELLCALQADHATARNEAAGRPPGTLPDASSPVVAIPADKALALERAVIANVDGMRLAFVPDGPFLEEMERKTGVAVPCDGPVLTRADGRQVRVFQVPGALTA